MPIITIIRTIITLFMPPPCLAGFISSQLNKSKKRTKGDGGQDIDMTVNLSVLPGRGDKRVEMGVPCEQDCRTTLCKTKPDGPNDDPQGRLLRRDLSVHNVRRVLEIGREKRRGLVFGPDDTTLLAFSRRSLIALFPVRPRGLGQFRAGEVRAGEVRAV